MVTFMKLFETKSIDNTAWGMLLEQVLLSQINPIRYIDYSGDDFKPKISCLIINNAGTGKDRALDVLMDFGKRMGLKISKIVDLQEAGLTGTVTNGKVMYGKLKDHDILMFPECENLFIRSAHKLTLIKHLQSALDNQTGVGVGGYVSKFVGGKNIEYNTDVSLVMASIPFNNLNEILIRQGIFQRCMLSIKDTGYKEMNEIKEKLRTTNQTKEERDKLIDVYIKDLKKKQIDREGEKVRVSTEVQKKVEDKIKVIFEEKRNLFTNSEQLKAFDTYFFRGQENVHRMAVNILFRDGLREVTEGCYDEPLLVYREHIESIFNIITRRNRIRCSYNKEAIKTLIKNHKGSKLTLYDKIEKEAGVSHMTAFRIYKEVNENGS